MPEITEEDVVLFYLPHIIQECKAAYKGLELEDRISEGTLAIIHSIRTYKIKYGNFEKYMLSQVRLIMKQKNKESWAVKKPESIYSLDASLVANNDSLTLHNFLQTTSYDDTILDVNCFVDQLSSIEKKILSHLLEDHNLNRTADKLNMPLLQIQQIIENIQIKYRKFQP